MRASFEFLDDQPDCILDSTPTYESRVGHSPVVKRRKLAQASSSAKPQVIESDHESDIMEALPPLTHAQHVPSTEKRPAASSRRSIGSGYTVTGGPGPTPQTECAATDVLSNSHRKKVRHPTTQAPSTQKSREMVALGLLNSDPIDVDSEPTQTKFGGFQQGIDGSAPSSVTTSNHFLNAKTKMNHSTHPPRGEPSAQSGSHVAPNLRDTFKRSSRVGEVEESSGDELAEPAPQPKKRNASQVNATKTTGSGMTSEGWLLKYARTNDFKGCEPEPLSLRSGKENSFRITTREENMIVTKHTISLSQINLAHTDNKSRMRLMGPKHADGSRYQVDLELANYKDFLLFQSAIQKSITLSKVVRKNE
jgi:hypothetical protein